MINVTTQTAPAFVGLPRLLQLQPDARVRGEVAAELLTEYTGTAVSKATLAKLRCIGGGPAFVMFGRFPMYTARDLIAWVDERTSTRVRSTSELPPPRRPRGRNPRRFAAPAAA